MEIKLGKVNKYTVLRETDIGYMLTFDGTDEFFLHRNETNYLNLNPGDVVDAFLYSDKKGRIAATLSIPTVTVDKGGFTKVKDVNLKIGAFLDIGTSKDVLLSRDDLPINFSDWPKADDVIACRLRVKGDRLVAKMLTKDEILENNKKIELTIDEKVEGYVYRITDDGINIVTNTYDVVYVYRTNMRKKYRLGEKVNVKIVRKNIDDYSGTLIEQKEKMIKDDREVILEYLKSHQGVMAITENSDPAVINHVFNMSKKSFKNAIGSLYKERIIEIHYDKIILL